MPLLRQSLSGFDMAWLRMERPTNPMMIVGVMMLAKPVRYEQVYRTLESRLLRFERFRDIPRSDAIGTRWETDSLFALESHVHRLTLPPRSGQRHLEAAVSELASTQLDGRHPLWQIHLIEHYRRGSVIIARFHHCYADGMALLRVLATLSDEAGTDPRALETPAADPVVEGVPLLGALVDTVERVTHGVTSLLSSGMSALAHPAETAALARQVSAASAELARIALLPEDPPTPLRQTLCTHKQAAWGKALKLDEVKVIAHALDCTVNDVLLSSTAGAIGQYLRMTGACIDGLSIRALVPINMRAQDASVELGNRFGLIFATLPIGEADPVRRIEHVHRDMQALKKSAQPLMSLWLLLGLGLLPKAIETEAIDIFTRKASLVISNVPGPQHPMHFAGARIAQQLFWVPQAGRLGLGVSLLSYDNRVNFGVIADRNVLADPASLVQKFGEEFERLLLCVISRLPPAPAKRRRTARMGNIP